MASDLRSLFLILLVAALAPVLVELPRRIRFPVVVAEIACGIAIGPQVLDWAHVDTIVGFMSNVGLEFLFFLAGMEINFDRIRGLPAKLGGIGWLLSAVLAACRRVTRPARLRHRSLARRSGSLHDSDRHPDADPRRRR
jgi:Kef-type K+ transport system membrane component KefB